MMHFYRKSRCCGQGTIILKLWVTKIFPVLSFLWAGICILTKYKKKYPVCIQWLRNSRAQVWVTLTCARLIHGSTRSPLILVGIVPLDAGQVGHPIVPPHHKDEAQHDTHPEVDALVRHGGYHFPGIFARVVALNAETKDT